MVCRKGASHYLRTNCVLCGGESLGILSSLMAPANDELERKSTFDLLLSEYHQIIPELWLNFYLCLRCSCSSFSLIVADLNCQNYPAKCECGL